MEVEIPSIESLLEANKQSMRRLYKKDRKKIVDVNGKPIRAKCNSLYSVSIHRFREEKCFDLPKRQFQFGWDCCLGLTDDEARLVLGYDYPEDDAGLVAALLHISAHDRYRWDEKPNAYVIEDVHRAEWIAHNGIWTAHNGIEVSSVDVDFYTIAPKRHASLALAKKDAQGIIKSIETEQKAEREYLNWTCRHEKFVELIRDMKRSLHSGFCYQYVSSHVLEEATETVNGSSLEEIRIGLDKLITDLIGQGAEEAALTIMENFNYPYEERENIAKRAYDSVANHIEDSDFGLALFMYQAEDGVRHDLELARIAKGYPLGIDAKEYAKSAITQLKRSHSMSNYPKETREYISEIEEEYELMEE